MQSIKVGTVVVNTPLVCVKKGSVGFHMYITCKDGSIIEHEPFSNDLQGMVAAISLAAEICAGKFYLNKVVRMTATNDKPALEGAKGHLNG